MRPRRAARPPAAPAGSARSIIGAVAHRGEDPPHDGVLAADSVQRVVIIRPPASRSRFGGPAFDDPHDVEGAHVRHDPPSPGPLRAANRCHRFGTRARMSRAPRPAMGDGTGRIVLPITAEQAKRIQIPYRALRSAIPRGARPQALWDWRRTQGRAATAVAWSPIPCAVAATARPVLDSRFPGTALTAGRRQASGMCLARNWGSARPCR